MTVGYWFEEALSGLGAAAKAVEGGGPVSGEDTKFAISARSQVYSGLARVTELLLGYRPVAELPTRGGAEVLFSRQGQNLSRFYVGLRLAAETSGIVRPERSAAGPGQAINQAAGAISIMGDILASHAPLGKVPTSPEGVAIRAGGGVPAALGDVARLAAQALRFDHQFARWLDRATSVAEAFRVDKDVARWSASGRISAAARELISEVPARSPLRDLDIAPAPPRGLAAQAVETVRDALTALDSARIWMWRTPSEVTVAHLQVSTRVGLAVHLMAGDGDPQVTGGWRRAAIAAAELRGTPPLDVRGRAAVKQAAEVLRWVRGLPSSEDASLRSDLAQLIGKLPGLAATVDRGLRNAVGRRDLFVKDGSVLVPAPGKLIYRAVSRWRPARSEDDLVRDVVAGLRQTHDPETASVRAGVAARAFAPFRRRNAEQLTSSLPMSVPGRVRQAVTPLER